MSLSSSRLRVLTALLLAPLAIGAMLLLPTPLLLPLVGAILLLAAWEWTALAGLEAPLPRACALLLPSAAMALLAHQPLDPVFRTVVVLGCLWWLASLVWLWRPKLLSGTEQWRSGFKLGLLLPLLVPAWAALALLHADGSTGPRWALFAVALVWAADTGAYYAGTRIGGRKLAPRISPGKTWAGLFGGLAAALLLPVVTLPLLGLAWSQLPALMLLTLLATLASVHGDLFESVMKRQRGAKDSGNLIPGHGGVLDRVDSLLAALPVFALGKLWLGL
ncbi:MAG: phosphatidate cytidylyltransferase [Aquimonas sp.]|nr:phosphatidate cytidylyltransferase [Aquimonas sp.]